MELVAFFSAVGIGNHPFEAREHSSKRKVKSFFAAVGQ
jgi:hypothetical protein